MKTADNPFRSTAGGGQILQTEHEASEARIAEASAQAVVEGRSVREEHQARLQGARTQAHRRDQQITAKEAHRGEHFIAWLQHVQDLRQRFPDSAVAAHGRMSAEVNALEPNDDRIWKYAVKEAIDRKLISPDFLRWCADVVLGYHNNDAPAADASAERSDGSDGSFRADGP